MKFSRRAFCGMGLSGLGLSALTTPQLAWARPTSPGERKFLFIYLWGGADQTTVLAPTMDHSNIPNEEGAEEAWVGDLRFVDHPIRPSVRAFFEGYGEQSAILHGFEVRSIAHERCQQLILTGTADAAVDDWPTLLAANGSPDLLLPCLVHSGPSYSAQYTDRVVRAGETGQFSQLLDGTALQNRIDAARSVPHAATSSAVDAYLAEQIRRLPTRSGRETKLVSAYSRALERLTNVKTLSGTVDLTVDTAKALPDRIVAAVDCLELGLSRTAMIEYRGVNDEGFDTHANNNRQSGHHEELYGYLLEIADDLASRPGQSGGSLLDETVMVVFSEMGRHPLLNFEMGKDHWTYTSVLLMGGGITGGQVCGGYNEDFLGAPTDLASGAVHPSGVPLLANHLGATLLALGDIDPGDYLPGIEPLRCLL